MAGSLALKNNVELVTQLPQSRRQVHDVPSAAESVPPISDCEVTCGLMTRPATLSSSATSSSNSTDFSSSSNCETEGASQNNHQSVSRSSKADWNRNGFSWRQKVLLDRSSFSCAGCPLHARIIQVFFVIVEILLITNNES